MMTIRYVPRDQVPVETTDPLIRSIESASIPYTGVEDSFSTRQITQALDFRLSSAREGFKRVYHTGVWFEKQKLPWMNTD